MSTGVEKVPHLKSWAVLDAQTTITDAAGTVVTFGAPPPGYVWDVLTVAAAVPGDAGPWLAHVYAGSEAVPEHAVGVGRSAAGDLAVTFDAAREVPVQPGEPLVVRLSGYAAGMVGAGVVRARARVRLLEVEAATWPPQPVPVAVVSWHPEADWGVEVPTEAVDG